MSYPAHQLSEEIESRITAAYAAEGYVLETDDGVRRDVRARNEAALAAFGGREATSKLDKGKAALTPGELYQRVFPSGPGAEGDVEALDAEDRAAYERLKRELAARDWDDMNHYAEAKGELIRAIRARG
jgi:hypothetical protein